MTLIQRNIDKYFDELSIRWNTDGTLKTTTLKVPSLATIIDQCGVIGGVGDKVYFGSDAVREAGLPTQMDLHQVLYGRE